MDTLRIGLGYSARYTVTLRYQGTRRAVAGVYGGSEPLSLVIGDPSGVALGSPASTVAWDDAAAGTVTLEIDDADTLSLGLGTFGLSIVLTDGGEPIECYRAALKVEPRPGGSPYA